MKVRCCEKGEFESLKVKILGSAGSYQSPSRQCSSYLVIIDGISFLLDAGNGSFGNLLKVHDPFDIGAVFLSHRHHDHLADIISLYHYLKFVPNGEVRRDKIPLFASRITHDFLSNFAAGSIFDIFERRVVAAGELNTIEGVEVGFGGVNHVDGSLSISLKAQSGETLFYSGDSAYSSDLAASIPGGSTLITESTYLIRKEGSGKAIHMDAMEVAQLCNDAKVSGVIVTHVAHPNDPDVVGDLVRQSYTGYVEVARDLDIFQIDSDKIVRLTSISGEGI